MIIGFTGTREGMTARQLHALRVLILAKEPKLAHHGLCVGADAQFHEICKAEGIPIVGHPPLIPDLMAPLPSTDFITLYGAQDYVTRNHVIVDMCQYLFAAPKEEEEQARGGTWSTIRYARKVRRRHAIVFPNSSVTWSHQQGAG